MDLQIIGDRYELLEPIGRGGMATIYRARDQRMGRLVAVKILREMYSSDPKFVLRFQREARAVSALAHPNIVQVFDYGKSEDQYYIVMELIEGIDLRKYLRANGILDLRRAVVIAHDVALALGAAHRRGIVHRDVKPQNILVNDEALVKLTDFGIATFYRDVNSERLTTTGMTLGTVQYYAPEQAQGEVVQPAADVYALGVVLYEMLVGHPPFDGDTPVAIAVRHIQEPPVRPSRYNPNIPPPLERVILRCLEKDPRDRYRDGDALAYALETFDKPRNVSSGRMQTPMGAIGSAPYPSAPGRPPSNPRMASGPMNRLDYDPTMAQGTTRADMIAGTTPGTAANPYARDLDEDGKEKPSPAVGVTAAVIVASVLLLLGVACFLVFRVLNPNPNNGLNSGQVQLPNFVNMKYTDALAEANHDNLILSEHTQQTTDQSKNGIVLNQDPTAPRVVQAGTTINVTVGVSPNSAIIPNVVGEPQQQATSDLKTAG
ncbi:MAG TPA: Stk1 family PASTA domain-containing Ser/Thr kinase, partial [Ktedonobacterales bacterium]|nr:Stk1 family PASTA domain-containing Ser/Thr kinase [Ktedonobacterales bacterium]